MSWLRLAILAMIPISLVFQQGCSSPPVRTTARFDNAFVTAATLYLEYTLPNSMARPEGFDLNGHLKQVHAEFVHVSEQFFCDSGIAYLQRRMMVEDEQGAHCIIEILTLSHKPAALSVLSNFAEDRPDALPARLASDERERVMGHAKEAMSGLLSKHI